MKRVFRKSFFVLFIGYLACIFRLSTSAARDNFIAPTFATVNVLEVLSNIQLEPNTGLSVLAATERSMQKDTVTGVKVPGLFNLPVVQQPESDSVYVSPNNDELTQFGLPKSFGTTSLLAHNGLSGSLFYQLTKGMTVIIVFGDGKTQDYKVSEIETYQALDPENIYSNFVDLNNTSGPVLTSAELFRRVYKNSSSVVFQTCFEKDDVPSWGRLFVIAYPVIKERGK
jgi:hypothetical protein